MPATGYIQLRAYESYAQLPLENVAIVIASPDGTAIAMRITDRNGRIAPIEIPVPDKAESQSPNPDEKPYTTVNLYAYLKDYELIESRDIQVFADTTTDQELEMVPLSELPWNNTDDISIYQTPPQDL